MDSTAHQQFLADFIRLERAVGGPDPHMAIACDGLARSHPQSVEDRTWLACCYVGPYNIPTTEVLLAAFPEPEAILRNEAAWLGWVETNWWRLSFRRERRAIRTPRKFAHHMAACAAWTLNNAPYLGALGDPDAIWSRLLAIPGNGRYATIKMYEALHRLGVIHPPFPDIRAHGGWSPRETLSWLHPAYSVALVGGDTPTNIQVADDCAARTRRALGPSVGEVDWYTLEVTLCEYKQAWEGGQYPGRAHDSELGHYRKVAPLWPDVDFKMLDLRAELFPHVALGEFSGWDGRRDGLGDCPSRHGYMWSDIEFVWSPGVDLSDPPRREGA